MTTAFHQAQAMSALDAANVARSFRAEVKHQVARGERSIVDLIDDPPGILQTMQVHALLMSLPGYGRSRSVAVLNLCRLSHSKTLGALSERQRGELIGVLRQRGVR